MKAIIAVIFFGILTYANELTQEEEQTCTKETAMIGFEPKKFFNGTWYALKLSDTRPNSCQKFKTEVKTGEETVSYFVETGPKKIGDNRNYECEGKKENDDDQYSFRCISDECGEEDSDTDVVITVLETDYVDYAYAVRCDKYTSSGKIEESLWFLERKKLEGEIDATEICENS